MRLKVLLRSALKDGRGHEALALSDYLQQLVHVRRTHDDALGRLAMMMQIVEGWRSLGFASFTAYCEQRLGMDAAHVERLADRARKAARRGP